MHFWKAIKAGKTKDRDWYRNSIFDCSVLGLQRRNLSHTFTIEWDISVTLHDLMTLHMNNLEMVLVCKVSVKLLGGLDPGFDLFHPQRPCLLKGSSVIWYFPSLRNLSISFNKFLRQPWFLAHFPNCFVIICFPLPPSAKEHRFTMLMYLIHDSNSNSLFLYL